MTSLEWVKKQRIERPSQLKRKTEEHFEQSIASINQTSKFSFKKFEKDLKWFKNAQLSCFHMMRHISDIASPHVSRSGELSPPPGSSFSPASPTVAQSSHGLCGDLWATQMDTAPSAAVTSHPGSPPSTGGLDPGWQPSTGEPLPYSLSVTGEPPYLALSTNGTPVNMIIAQKVNNQKNSRFT